METATAPHKRRFAQLAAFAASAIDHEAGIIPGVAVITEGPALGHGMLVDATTLEQVKTCAEKFTGGLKVKMDHWSTVNDIVGFLRNFRIDGKVLRADLHLLQSAPTRAYVLELATTIPDTVGLSISFSGVDEKTKTAEGMEIVFARCTEIYSADLVDQPAANPTGLFSAIGSAAHPFVAPDGFRWVLYSDTGTTLIPLSAPPAPTALEAETQPNETTSPMTEEEMAGLTSKFEEMLAPLSARLQALEDAMPKSDDEEEELSPAAMSWPEEERKAFAADVVKETIKALRLSAPTPQPASPPAPDPDPEPKAKTFEALVAEAVAEGQDKNAAIRNCVVKHPKAYEAYRARVEKGERITL